MGCGDVEISFVKKKLQVANHTFIVSDVRPGVEKEGIFVSKIHEKLFLHGLDIKNVRKQHHTLIAELTYEGTITKCSYMDCEVRDVCCEFSKYMRYVKKNQCLIGLCNEHQMTPPPDADR